MPGCHSKRYPTFLTFNVILVAKEVASPSGTLCRSVEVVKAYNCTNPTASQNCELVNIISLGLETMESPESLESAVALS